jgi:hypothetical protein
MQVALWGVRILRKRLAGNCRESERATGLERKVSLAIAMMSNWKEQPGRLRSSPVAHQSLENDAR